MEHALAKTILISKVVELIASKYRLPIDEARNELYNSQIIDLIDDDEAGLYGESPLYVFSLFEQHRKTNSKRMSGFDVSQDKTINS